MSCELVGRLAPRPPRSATQDVPVEGDGWASTPKARLIGVDLPREKRLEVALTYIFGIGPTRAKETLEATGISGDLRVHELNDDHLVALRDHIEANYQTEGDLRREISADIRRKIEIGSYQGRRHRAGLPVHGQRTRTNARSRKGKRKAVAGKKKAK